MFTIQNFTFEDSRLDHYHVQSEQISCKIYPNLGASLQELKCNSVSIIKGFETVDDYKIQHTSSVLCPFPGRVENGCYSYKNQSYQLEQNENDRDNAIHGKVAHESFELIESKTSEELAELSFSYEPKKHEKGFPFLYKVIVAYTIREHSMELHVQLQNKDDVSFPFGLGWHPYFYSSDLSNSILQFNSSKEILCTTEMIPNGEQSIQISEPTKLSDQHFDTCFILNHNHVSFQTPEYKITLEALDTHSKFLQLFTPASRDCIAIEPMTCAPDALNNRQGLLELSPHHSFDWKVQLDFETF